MSKEWATGIIIAGICFAFIFALMGCEPPPTGAEAVPPAPPVPVLKSVILSVDRFEDIKYVEFKIDGCEYIQFYTGHCEPPMHKPNCSNPIHGGNHDAR